MALHRSKLEDLANVSGIAHGVRIRGRLPSEFTRYLWPDAGPRDRGRPVLDVRCRAVDTLAGVEEIWAGEQKTPQAPGRMALFRQPDGFGLKVDCQGRGLFRVSPRRVDIEWLPGGTGPAHYFFSHLVPLWLAVRGLPVLHAGAVSFGNRAVAFLGESGAGKSTLCAAMVRAGAAFMADDGLALVNDAQNRWRGRRGPPLFRLWPSALAGHPGVAVEALTRVHPRFEKRLLPMSHEAAAADAGAPEIAVIYVLERRGGTAAAAAAARIEPCGPSESLVQLVEHSLAWAPSDALGLTAQRLEQLSRVVEGIAVKRLIYPSGRDRWEGVKATILEDLEGAL